LLVRHFFSTFAITLQYNQILFLAIAQTTDIDQSAYKAIKKYTIHVRNQEKRTHQGILKANVKRCVFREVLKSVRVWSDLIFEGRLFRSLAPFWCVTPSFHKTTIFR